MALARSQAIHGRMLDAIEETANGLLLSVRDPLHASFLTIELHETFWTHRMAGQPGGTASRQWDAIFLPRKQTAAIKG